MRRNWVAAARIQFLPEHRGKRGLVRRFPGDTKFEEQFPQSGTGTGKSLNSRISNDIREAAGVR